MLIFFFFFFYKCASLIWFPKHPTFRCLLLIYGVCGFLFFFLSHLGAVKKKPVLLLCLVMLLKHVKFILLYKKLIQFLAHIIKNE